MRYVVNDPDHGPALYEEEWEASRQFEDLVERLRERAADGWHPNAESAFWGEVVPREHLSLRGKAQTDTDQGAGMNMTNQELIEAVYTASTEWKTVSPPHPSYIFNEERIFGVTPQSVGRYYDRILCVCVLNIRETHNEYYTFNATFRSIDDGDVPLLGPFEDREAALKRAARFKELLSEYSHVPDISVVEKTRS